MGRGILFEVGLEGVLGVFLWSWWQFFDGFLFLWIVMHGLFFGEAECIWLYRLSNSCTLERNSCLEWTLRIEARKPSTC